MGYPQAEWGSGSDLGAAMRNSSRTRVTRDHGKASEIPGQELAADFNAGWLVSMNLSERQYGGDSCYGDAGEGTS